MPDPSLSLLIPPYNHIECLKCLFHALTAIRCHCCAGQCPWHTHWAHCPLHPCGSHPRGGVDGTAFRLALPCWKRGQGGCGKGGLHEWRQQWRCWQLSKPDHRSEGDTAMHTVGWELPNLWNNHLAWVCKSASTPVIIECLSTMPPPVGYLRHSGSFSAFPLCHSDLHCIRTQWKGLRELNQKPTGCLLSGELVHYGFLGFVPAYPSGLLLFG